MTLPADDDFVRRLPKAELHLHIEGTLEPELIFELAARNGVALAYPSVEALRAAYEFADLQSFLDLYYAGMSVLRTAHDFRAMTAAYLARAHADGVVHAEIFFDPQAHTARGVSFESVLEGIAAGLADGAARYGITHRLILCFLRDQSAASAMETLERARPHVQTLAAVGLDSAELGHPPAKFREVFDRARGLGLRAVAHAGEEGPPAYIHEALDVLGVERIDHGVRCLEDATLVARLRDRRVPLTVCPLSNVRLKVVPTMAAHPLKKLLDAGLCATVNSDDPAYFGGYVADNYRAVRDALGLGRAELAALARNSFEAAFLGDADKRAHLAAVDRVAAE